MRHILTATTLLVLTAAPAAAQLIPVRSVPMVRADRFDIFPSRNAGMGGVSIAPGDSAGDLTSNPAAGAELTRIRVYGSAVTYSVSDDAGGGYALPVGLVARRGDWFAAGALALQSVEPGRVREFVGPTLLEGSQPAPEPSRSSAYGFALLGRSWASSGLSIGASVLAARRKMVDGIDLLYGASEGAASSGAMTVYRLGTVKEWAGGRSIRAVAVHSRTRMTHDVTYAEPFWDPERQLVVSTLREERNADHTDVWGLHLVHARPLGPGWQVGWLITANAFASPHVPDYDVPSDGIMNIDSGRRDGHAWQVGMGVASRSGPLLVGLDLIHEPIRARIWGEADTATTTMDGGTIPAGGVTVENRLRFSNWILRSGVGREWRLDRPGDAVEVQLGLAMRLMDYRLAQIDHRQAAGRNGHERWLEWTPTWGAELRLGGVEARYHASVMAGTKRPGAGAGPVSACDACFARLSVAPGPANTDLSRLGAVRVLTQQISVSVPLGAASGKGGGQ